MDYGLVSIITPMYNSSNTISQMMESVLNQTYKNWELIIVDDYSSDNSCKIVKEYCERDSRIKLFRKDENSGPAESRNIAIKNSRGRFLAFLDSDDLWLEKKLEIQINEMVKANAEISCTSYLMRNIRTDKKSIFEVKSSITYEDLLKKNYFSCDTVVIDTLFCSEVFFFDYIMHEDYITWLNLMKKGGKAIGVNEVLAIYNIGGTSRSSHKIKATYYIFNVFRNFEGKNIFTASALTLNYALNGINKYLLKGARK